jgi:integrase/recombinase XerD
MLGVKQLASTGKCPCHRNANMTVHIYLFADLDLKERALDRTRPLASPPGRYQPPDDILPWLDAL